MVYKDASNHNFLDFKPYHQFHFCTVIHPALIMFSKALNILILKIMHKRLINYREKIFFQRNKIIKKIENLYV